MSEDVRTQLLSAFTRLPNTTLKTCLLIEKYIKTPHWQIQVEVNHLVSDGLLIETKRHLLQSLYKTSDLGKKYLSASSTHLKPLSLCESKLIQYSKQTDDDLICSQQIVLDYMNQHPRLFPSTLMIEHVLKKSTLDTIAVLSNLVTHHKIKPETSTQHQLWSLIF